MSPTLDGATCRRAKVPALAFDAGSSYSAAREVSARLRRLSPAASTVDLMPPLPRISGRELVRALGKLGWEVVAQRGSHAHLKHPAQDGRVTVPLHAGETIGPGLLRSILSQAGVTADELRRVL